MSAINKYLEPQPNETQSQRIARTEAVVKALPLWVEVMKEKTKQKQLKASAGFSAGLGSLADQILGENNQISTDGLTPASETPLPQGNGGSWKPSPSLFDEFRVVPYPYSK
jgi:hypothetical protein